MICFLHGILLSGVVVVAFVRGVLEICYLDGIIAPLLCHLDGICRLNWLRNSSTRSASGYRFTWGPDLS